MADWARKPFKVKFLSPSLGDGVLGVCEGVSPVVTIPMAPLPGFFISMDTLIHLLKLFFFLVWLFFCVFC